VRHQTAGRPLPGYELRSVDGELQVRGPHVTAGYHDEPELTAAAFDGPWFRTGDLGHVDERGCLRVTGRAKDVVLVGGFSVAPAEVESVLMTHPDVAGVVVVGVPHRRLGTALKAFVAPAGSRRPEAGALLRFARPRIAGYKLPYAIEIVDELPRLASGKPDRAALEQWGGRP
jgi:acyl-CoA synthetase (AMP-forming)/AMP-acid ligase II